MAVGDPYVSVAEFKARAGFSDSSDDTRISVAVNAASRMIEDHCHRQFNDAGSASARVFRSDTPTLARIDDFSTLTGLVVATGQTGAYTTTLTINVDFVVEPLNATLGNEVPLADHAGAYWRLRALGGGHIFPTGRLGDPNVQVTARWGWSAVPDQVIEACHIQASHLFRRKDSPEGIVGGFPDAPIRVGSKLDPDVAMLLERLVKHRTGMFVG